MTREVCREVLLRLVRVSRSQCPYSFINRNVAICSGYRLLCRCGPFLVVKPVSTASFHSVKICHNSLTCACICRPSVLALRTYAFLGLVREDSPKHGDLYLTRDELGLGRIRGFSPFSWHCFSSNVLSCFTLSFGAYFVSTYLSRNAFSVPNALVFHAEVPITGDVGSCAGKRSKGAF